jgi:hypothetical protein
MTTLAIPGYGSHDFVAAAGLVNTNNGLFWLSSTSSARGAACTSVIPPVDFLGHTQIQVDDIGFMRYLPTFETDSRNLATSALPDFWLDLNADITAPVISGVEYVVSYPYANVTWVTDEAAKSGLEWGTTTSYGSSTTNASLVTSHALTSGSLNQGTTYHYRVHSTDSAGNHAQSSDGNFTTTAAPAGKVTLRGTVTVRGLKP